MASCGVAVFATGMAFCFRIYLAHASAGLAARGAGEEALFALAIDPLWRLEASLLSSVGNPGTLLMMNVTGVVAWGVLFFLSLVLFRGMRSSLGRVKWTPFSGPGA
jgi:hypothetical protein